MSIALKTIKAGIFTTSSIAPKVGARIAIELLFRPGKSSRKIRYKKFWESGQPVQFKSGCLGRSFGQGSQSIYIVHGWQSQGSRFKGLIESLVSLGFKVVAWDGPGHGQSPGKRTHLAEFTRTLVSDLKERDDNIYGLVGHSFGGAACAYACQLGLDVKKLVLISAPSDTLGVFSRYWDFISLGKRSRNHFLKLAENEARVSADELSSRTFIESLDQDVQVIHCLKDRLVPYGDAEYLKEKKESIQLYTTNRLGHHRIIDSPEVIEQVVQFIGDKKPQSIAPPPEKQNTSSLEIQ